MHSKQELGFSVRHSVSRLTYQRGSPRRVQARMGSTRTSVSTIAGVSLQTPKSAMARLLEAESNRFMAKIHAGIEGG